MVSETEELVRDLSLHILDIIQNSLSAGSTAVTLTVAKQSDGNLLKVEISDNGRGMDQQMLMSVTDPFVTTRTTRKVGLGLPMLEQTAERSGGALHIWSTPGEGTMVAATFQYDNIDRPPLGSLTETLITLIATNPEVRFILRYEVDGKRFVFDTREVVAELGDVPINNPLVIEWTKQYLDEGIRDAGIID